MNGAQSQRPKFRRRTQPVTFVVARGDAVRHVTLEPSLIRRALIGGCAVCLAAIGLTVSYVPANEPSTTIEEHALRQNYETRLAAMRSKLDEATSRQFVTQKRMETKVDILLDQQDVITERYNRLRPVFDRARENGVLPPVAAADMPLPSPRPTIDAQARSAPPRSTTTPISAYSPTNDSVERRIFRTIIDRGASERDTIDGIVTGSLRPSTELIDETALRDVGQMIDHAELTQLNDLKVLTSEASIRASRIDRVLASIGIDIEPNPRDALGGPFEPAPEENVFDAQIGELEDALDRLEDLRGMSYAIPLRSPLSEGRITSRFGVRSDPFIARRALHAGIDWAARKGSPIRATAAGTIVRAGRAGGYGNLVEIDHGNGLKTRFGHMSRIDVKAGQTVNQGDVVGAVGSTGRSTGSHLHYEIRKDGKAVDPMRFIRAGSRLDAIV